MKYINKREFSRLLFHLISEDFYQNLISKKVRTINFIFYFCVTQETKNIFTRSLIKLLLFFILVFSFLHFICKVTTNIAINFITTVLGQMIELCDTHELYEFQATMI